MRTEDRRDRIIDKNRARIKTLEEWCNRLINENNDLGVRIRRLEEAMFR